MNTTSRSMKFRVKGMFILLCIQYIVGMLLNLFSTDDPAKKTILQSISFFSHIIIGVFLVLGALFILLATRKTVDKQWSKNAVGGFFSIFVAFITGIMTMALKDTASEISSFIMAVSFLG